MGQRKNSPTLPASDARVQPRSPSLVFVVCDLRVASQLSAPNSRGTSSSQAKEGGMSEPIYCEYDDSYEKDSITTVYTCWDCKKTQEVVGDHEPEKRVCRGPEAQRLRKEGRADRGRK
jgi:hypothetical protein